MSPSGMKERRAFTLLRDWTSFRVGDDSLSGRGWRGEKAVP
jgi:hypothetical protein